MRVGVVGCGYWGSKHVRTLSTMSTVDQVVVIDPRPEIRSTVGADFPGALQRPTLASALGDVDAVVVATPPVTHFDLAAEAIEAGKHVLVEKPMTTTSRDGAELVRLADEAGVTLAAGHTFAHNPAVWKLSELIEGGELGQLHYLDGARLNLGLYRSDVNVVWDLAAHDISIAVALLGDAPDTVAAWGSCHTRRFGEDVATVRMQFDARGVEATVRVSWLDPVKVRRTTAVGSKRMAVFNDLDADAPVKVFDRGRDQQSAGQLGDAVEMSYRLGDTLCPAIATTEPLRAELTDFVECCISGRQPLADGRAGLTVVAALEASDRSMADNGVPVALELPVLDRPATAA